MCAVTVLDLARRIEGANAHALASHSETAAQLFPELGATSIPVAGGVASFVGAQSPISYAVGLGMREPVTSEDIGRVVEFYESRGMVPRVDVCPLADASLEHYHQVLDVNLTSVFAACRAAIPIMRKHGAGNIITVTSIAAGAGRAAGAGIYAAAKAAVSTLTRNLAKEEAPHNIRVNAVSPGVITTPFHEKVSTPAQLEAARASIPLGRLGTAEECVGTFLYLASDTLSRYVDGQIIEVNGGQFMP